MKIEIEKLIFEGFGLGHDKNGKSVFIRKSVPGDIVDIEIIKDKKNYAEGIIKKIINPSLERITPKCPYFEKCGGCEHMNISYNNQVIYKDKIFREIFGRAKINKMPLPVIPGSNSDFYYRNSIRFFFVNNPKGINFARHNYIYNKGLVEIDKCYLQSETANEILIQLKTFINENVEDRSLFWQLKIREGKVTKEFMIEIITSGDELPGEKGIINTLKKIPEIKSIYHTIAPGKSLLNLKRRLIYGSPIIHEKIGKFNFEISPESFFQTNSLGIHTLYEKIKEFAEVKIGDTVLDLYCGTGSIGIYLSTFAKKVTGIEIVKEAIRDAKDNAKINRVLNCEFICADATKWLRQNSKQKFDKIIVDPPRAGLTEELISNICHLNFDILIYVSCNPATFARDIKLFESFGKKLIRVQPIDMFPQTHHIECVSLIK
ncbi:MAG: 23S rRNA (uracil(1939)-C(5))-methyltransferase RlmD [Patescibacteria group bacterium]